MTVKRLATSVVISLLVVLLGFLIAPYANAEPSLACTAVVMDETDKKVLDIARIENVASGLESVRGAQVYVRAFQKMPGGSTDAFFRSQQASCAEWYADDIIVVTFGMDRTSGIYFGPKHDALEDAYETIRINELGDNLRKGDFTTAVVAALDEISSTLDPNATPSESAPPTNWGAVFKWIGIAVGAILLLILVIAAGFKLVAIRDTRIAERRKLARLRDRAIAAYRQAGLAVTAFPSNDKLKADWLMATAYLPADDVSVSGWQTEFAEFCDQGDAYVSDYADLTREVASDPESTGLTVNRYEELIRRYAVIGDGLSEVAANLKALHKKADQIKTELLPQRQHERLEETAKVSEEHLELINACELVFNVQAYRTKADDFKKSVEHLKYRLTKEDPWVTLGALNDLQKEASALSQEFRTLQDYRIRILESEESLYKLVESVRKALNGLKYADVTKPLMWLTGMEREINGFVSRELSPTRSHVQQIQLIEEFEARIRKLSDDSVAAEKKAKAEKAERDRVSRPSSSRTNSGRSSSNDSFAGGYAGGVVGGSFGHTSSPSTHHDSGGGFSGGGGSWGGGGGGFDGGGGGGGW
jgi:uncharacterized membrane protein YgcG